jgi:hypothetical protein
LLQRRCNITAIDAAFCRARNDRMMKGAHTPGSSSAFCARRLPADPGEAAENAETPEIGETAETRENTENGENAENREILKTARRWGEGGATASTAETLKHETPPASHGAAETVKHTGWPPRRAAAHGPDETLKQSRKRPWIQALRCFTPSRPEDPGETPGPYVEAPASEAAKREATPVIAPRNRAEAVKRRANVRKNQAIGCLMDRRPAIPVAAHKRDPYCPQRARASQRAPALLKGRA